MLASAAWSPLYPLITEPLGAVYSTLAALLFCGLAMGYLARLLHLPNITGNILAGVLLGPVFGIVDTLSPTTAGQIEPITDLAISLIAISIGSHLRFAILHNALKRILVIVAMQSVVLPLVTYAGLYYFMTYTHAIDAEIKLGHILLFLSILSLATAPATIIHVVKEAQAKGIFVKTLIAVVVLNNVVNIALFELAKEFVFEAKGGNFSAVVGEICAAALLGVFVAALLMYLRRKVFCNQRAATFSMAALLITYGVSLELGLSPIIANLSLGIFLANFSDRNQILELFEDFEEFIYSLFFTLTGTHANFNDMSTVGLLAVAFVFLRILGNMATVTLSRYVTPVPKRVNKYLGLALTPQAGITIGLVVALESVDETGTMVRFVTPIVLTAVTFAEVIGPLLLRYCIRRSGEEGQALPRLIDFLEEEFITTDVHACDKQGVIIELVDFLYRTHDIDPDSKTAFLETVLKREKESSTGLGRGVAIPHGYLPEGSKMMGVMGIIRDGMDWQALDGKSVYMVILVGTPPELKKQHLGAMATISKLFSRRTVVQRGLHQATTPAQVYEAIADEEFISLNRVIQQS